jgi:hypothetical protein
MATTISRETWRESVRAFCESEERSIRWVGEKAGLAPTSNHIYMCLRKRAAIEPSDDLLTRIANVIGAEYAPEEERHD